MHIAYKHIIKYIRRAQQKFYEPFFQALIKIKKEINQTVNNNYELIQLNIEIIFS
jgi:hypothetical protein